MNKSFDPNAACVPNNQYFGFPYTPQEASLLLLAVPWEVTTSYQEGTAKGPQAILEASYQLDFYDADIPQAWNLGIGTFPSGTSDGVALSSMNLRPLAKKIIHWTEENKEDENLAEDLALVNQASEMLNDWVYEQAQEVLQKGKKMGIVGGDHSVPLGYLKALAEKYTNFGILHIDAHADLRKAYEGFTYSHASIMYNALQIPSLSSLVQIGLRDICEEEINRASADKRIWQFSDANMQANTFRGITWEKQCASMLAQLPQKVYISFDIDGLDPSLCPHTGTPVPGGLSYGQVVFLLKELWRSGREIIGFDLCEVAPASNEVNTWDGNVGARILYLLGCITLASKDK
ncbi:MAG: agmatinase family protein [Bacteroidales bacterium]